VDLTAADVPTETCLYLPPAAIPGVKLPKRLIVQGASGEAKLVGATAVEGAQDESAIKIAPAALRQLSPDGTPSITVPATLRPATWWDVYACLGTEDFLKIAGAMLAFVLAVLAALGALITNTGPLWIAVAVLALTSVTAAFTARDVIRGVLNPKCR
jgi:hypothetical protein